MTDLTAALSRIGRYLAARDANRDLIATSAGPGRLDEIMLHPGADGTLHPLLVSDLRAVWEALVAERDLAAAREAAAAQAMREAAAKSAKWHSDRLVDTIRALPIPDTAALDRLIAEARREAFEEAALHLTSIFYPEDRTGYEAAEQMTKAHDDVQARAVRSYPGAKGDVPTALSMAVRQHESVIAGAKVRYERIRQALLSLASKEGRDG